MQDPRDHAWFVPRPIQPRDNFDIGLEKLIQLESPMQDRVTELRSLENISDSEHDINEWVRGSVDGILVDVSQFSNPQTDEGIDNGVDSDSK